MTTKPTPWAGAIGPLLLVLLTTSAAALPTPTIAPPLSAEALYWATFQTPIEERIQALVDGSGIEVKPEVAIALDALKEHLAEGEAAVLRHLPTYDVPTSGRPKWFTVGVEGCTGDGTCGGSYSDNDGSYNTYVSFNNNNTFGNATSTSCSHNTVMLNPVILSDNAEFCRAIAHSGFNMTWYNETSDCAADGGAGCGRVAPGFIIDFRCYYDVLNKRNPCPLVDASTRGYP